MNKLWLLEWISCISLMFQTMISLNWQCWASLNRWSLRRYNKFIEKKNFFMFWWLFWQRLKWKFLISSILCVELILSAEVTITIFEWMSLKRLDALLMIVYTINCFAMFSKSLKSSAKMQMTFVKRKNTWTWRISNMLYFRDLTHWTEYIVLSWQNAMPHVNVIHVKRSLSVN